MPEIDTNYNYPVPPENVYGQTIGGPSVENPQQQVEQDTTQVQQTQSTQETKGKYIDRYA